MKEYAIRVAPNVDGRLFGVQVEAFTGNVEAVGDFVLRDDDVLLWRLAGSGFEEMANRMRERERLIEQLEKNAERAMNWLVKCAG